MATRLGWLALAVLCAAAISPPLSAQVPKDSTEKEKEKDKAFEKSIEETLRKVIDHGAAIYNKQSDHNGCFRLFEGSLMTLRPVLTAYPELQKAIDDGLADAYGKPRVDQRAMALREVLGKIRVAFNPNLRPKTDSKDDTKKDDKKTEKLPDPSLAQVTGKVMWMGKPLTAGHVVLVGADGGRSSAKILKDGTYDLKPGIPPGDYAVIVEEPAGDNSVVVPQKYKTPATSPLRLKATKGAQVYDLMLD